MSFLCNPYAFEEDIRIVRARIQREHELPPRETPVPPVIEEPPVTAYREVVVKSEQYEAVNLGESPKSSLMRLSVNDIPDYLREACKSILTDHQLVVMDLVLQRKDNNQIAELHGMTSIAVASTVSLARRKIEKSILNPAGIIRVKYFKDHDLYGAIYDGLLKAFKIGEIPYTHPEWEMQYREQERQVDEEFMAQGNIPLNGLVSPDVYDTALTLFSRRPNFLKRYKKRVYVDKENQDEVNDWVANLLAWRLKRAKAQDIISSDGNN